MYGGSSVIHLLDRFNHNTPDTKWISELSEEGDWVIISGDIRISRSPAERQAWRECGLITFFREKGWMNLTLWEQAWRFIKWWPEIVKMASGIKAPAAFTIPVSSSKLRQLHI